MNAESAWRFFGIRVECAKDVGIDRSHTIIPLFSLKFQL